MMFRLPGATIKFVHEAIRIMIESADNVAYMCEDCNFFEILLYLGVRNLVLCLNQVKFEIRPLKFMQVIL